jgi:hypothetical protein
MIFERTFLNIFVTGIESWNDFVGGPVAILVVLNIVGRCHDAVVGKVEAAK